MSSKSEAHQQNGTKASRIADWFSQSGVTFTQVEIFSDTEVYGNDAYGIRALQDIAEGDVIATIPKAKVISGKTSSLGAFLEENKLGGKAQSLPSIFIKAVFSSITAPD